MAALHCNPRYGKSGLASNPRSGLRRAARSGYDAVDGGTGQFANPPNAPITYDGAPYKARLRVFNERSGRLVREAWSNDDGTWIIAGLNRTQQYLIVCYDGVFPAQAFDRQTPDPMP